MTDISSIPVALYRDVLGKFEKPMSCLRMNLHIGHEIDFSGLRFQRAHQWIELSASLACSVRSKK